MTTPPSNTHLRVLLLDDDQTELATVGQILTDAGIYVELCATPEEALPLLCANADPYVVLLAAHAEPDANRRSFAALTPHADIWARCTGLDIAQALGHLAAQPIESAAKVLGPSITPHELIVLLQRDYLVPREDGFTSYDESSATLR